MKRKKRLKKILSLSVPVMLSQFTDLSGNFLTTYFLSRLGGNELAASGLITPTQNLLIAPAMACLQGASVLAAERIARSEENTVGGIWHQNQLLGLTFSTMALPVLLFSGSLFSSLNQSEELADIAQRYFRYYIPAYVGTLLITTNQQIFLAQKRAIPIFCTTSLQTLLDVSLGLCLSQGYFNLPKLGVIGLSIGYSISATTVFLGSTVYLLIDRNNQRYALFKFSSEKMTHVLQSMLKRGLPLSLQIGAELVALWLAMMMVGEFGKNQLSAAEIAGQYVFLLTVPASGLGRSTSILIGRAFGKGKLEEVRKLGMTSMLLSQAMPCLGMIFFVSAPSLLTSFFLNGNTQDRNEIMQLSATLLLINGGGQFFDAFRQVAMGALVGQSDNLLPALLNVSSMCVIGTLLSYGMGFLFGLGTPGVFIARSVAMAFAASVVGTRWYFKAGHTEPPQTKPDVVVMPQERTQCPSFASKCWAFFFKPREPDDETYLLVTKLESVPQDQSKLESGPQNQ